VFAVGHNRGQGRGYVWIQRVITGLMCLWIASHLFAAPQSKSDSHQTKVVFSLPDIVFVQTPKVDSGSLAQRFPNGSRIVLLKTSTTSGTPVSLTDGFFAAADPQISFQGNKILFSAQKNKSDRWQVWEMDLDGSNERQITNCADHCLRAAYLSADEIALTVEQLHGQKTRSFLAVVKSDGSQLRRITFGPAEFRLETVLRDGRIVASAPWPLNDESENGGSRMLYTLRPDGTALESIRCEHGESTVPSNASELEHGAIVFVRHSHDGTIAGGDLMQIQRGSAVATRLGTHAAVYESAREITATALIAATASRTATGSGPKFELYILNAKTGELGKRIFTDPQLSSIQAIPVVTQAVPKHFWTTLNPESNSGYFISLNSYLSMDAPGGRWSKNIAQVRVLTLNPVDGREHTLGEAPVESDGSFYVRVPANEPVRFVLLDAKGQTIREEHGWVWTRPGEQRGCTGCHGDKSVAPENHWPLTLKRFDTPTSLGDSEHAPAISTAQ
jgi:Hydrazine synthase alpha subunit middle domain